MIATDNPIRAYRHRQQPRVKLAQLADLIGTSKTTLSQIENGKRPVSLDLLPRLKEITGLSLDVLRPDLAAMFPSEAAE